MNMGMHISIKVRIIDHTIMRFTWIGYHIIQYIVTSFTRTRYVIRCKCRLMQEFPILVRWRTIRICRLKEFQKVGWVHRRISKVFPHKTKSQKGGLRQGGWHIYIYIYDGLDLEQLVFKLWFSPHIFFLPTLCAKPFESWMFEPDSEVKHRGYCRR